MKIDKYLRAFSLSWQYQLEYRLNNLVHILVAAVSLISIFYLWNDVFSGRAVVAGYSRQQIVTYYVIVGYLFASIFRVIPVANEIQTGFISIYLTKPISYIFYTYWQSLAARLFRLVAGLPVLVLVLIVLHRHLFLVTDPLAYLWLLLAAFGAINILFLCDLIVGMMEFWFQYSDSLTTITDSIIRFFAGTLLPVALLPIAVQQVGYWLPFRYTGTFIIDAFMGRLSAGQIALGIGVQLIWTGLLALAAAAVWQRGLKRYEASGA
jgi:ABC-2 type transport system permease protein